ncbi:hypothetical protein ACJRO7_023774 [Eucalyptus globulus]|uniref:Protein kinase domain-containing protein n=1 Tax=Eucalyptus globulus TaxID=34317 RepID=A0ABD3K5E5_EUCGL
MRAAVLCFLSIPVALALATFTVKDNCDRTCGNMSVPFPSGLDESCAWNSYLVLSRNHTSRDLSLGDNIPVLDISVKNGTMTIGQYRAFDCYDENGHLLDDSVLTLRSHLVKTGNIHSHFSDTQNKLTVFGCDTSAVILDATRTSESGCFSYCREDINFIAESYCSGYRCCETSIPRSLRSLHIFMSGSTNYTSVQDFSSYFLSQMICSLKNNQNVVLDWVVERELTCKAAQSNRPSYACGANSFCSDFRRGQGYRCFCDAGCTGIPYASPLSPGCQGITLIKDPRRYPLHGNCKNTPRNYTCDCPFGMTGDGKVGCQISSLATTAAEPKRDVRQNGGEILKHQRVKIFTEAQSAKATNHYDTSNKLGEGGFASIYKGRIDGDVLFAIKKPKDVLVNKSKDMNKDLSLSTHDEFLHEISIISQVNHKNLVKLLGICLETNVPLLVYEFIPNGTLYHHIHDKRSTVLRSWKNCLRIASEATLALEYLHSLADSPVIHSDVKFLNILLDKKHSAKVSDFGASADRVQGTIGYLDPKYLTIGELTTKSDVYKKYGEKINTVQFFISPTENQTLIHMTKFEASNEGELQEIEAVGSLGRRCLNFNGVERSTMKEVAEQLARINKNLWANQQDDEETRIVLDETGCDSLRTSISEMNKLNRLLFYYLTSKQPLLVPVSDSCFLT